MKKTNWVFCFVVIFAVITMVLPMQSCDPEDDEDKCDTCLVLKKPNIYVYPEQNIELSLEIEFPQGGQVVTSIPEYGNGWLVNIDTTGLINNNFTYLFYESIQPNHWQKKNAWVIKKQELETFFKTNMTNYGFLGQEIDDFIEYWIPLLNEYNYFIIYPQTSNDIEKLVRLNFSLEPDRVLRLFYFIEGKNTLTKDLPELPVPDFTFLREGFFVCEWGVIYEP